jgi:uncharacterized protein YqgC (DUF456 family)
MLSLDSEFSYKQDIKTGLIYFLIGIHTSFGITLSPFGAVIAYESIKLRNFMR